MNVDKYKKISKTLILKKKENQFIHKKLFSSQTLTKNKNRKWGSNLKASNIKSLDFRPKSFPQLQEERCFTYFPQFMAVEIGIKPWNELNKLYSFHIERHKTIKHLLKNTRLKSIRFFAVTFARNQILIKHQNIPSSC